MSRPIRTIPVAAVGLSFTAGCHSSDAIVGTWDAVRIEKGGEDVTADYLYADTYEDCTYSSAIVLAIGVDLTGGLFETYTYECTGAEPYSYSGGGGEYVTAEHDGGRWLLTSGELRLDCTLGGQLACDLAFEGDAEDYGRRWTFEKRESE